MKNLFILLLFASLLFTACKSDASSEGNNIHTNTTKTINKSSGDTQKNKDFLSIANIYLRYNNRGPALADELDKELDEIKSPSLESIKKFVRESPKRNDSFLTEKFLKKPTNKELDNFYIMRTITWSTFRVDPLGPEFVDTLDFSGISYDEKLSAYYRLLFTNLLIDPFQPSDYSGINIDLNKLGLENNQEKAILFYTLATTFSQRYLQNYNRSKEICNKIIAFSNTFPKINGQHFYEVTPPPLKDFLMKVGNGSTDKSFKAYFSEAYIKAVKIFESCRN